MTKLFSDLTSSSVDWFQARAIVVADSSRQLYNDWLFEKGFMMCSKVDSRFLKPKKVKLSDLLIETNFISSRKEFHRKVSQKGLKCNGNPIEADFEIDTTVPNCMDYEIRLGCRFLEIVVPGKAPLLEYWIRLLKFQVKKWVQNHWA